MERLEEFINLRPAPHLYTTNTLLSSVFSHDILPESPTRDYQWNMVTVCCLVNNSFELYSTFGDTKSLVYVENISSSLKVHESKTPAEVHELIWICCECSFSLADRIAQHNVFGYMHFHGSL